MASFATPQGYLTMYGFSMLPLIIGIFAVLAGSGLLASDEEGGQLDLIIAHPVGRTALFWGRAAALAGASVGILTIGWLGFVALLGGSSLQVTAVQMALPFVDVLAQALIWGALALLLSMVLPSRGVAAAVSGAVLVTSYFLSSLSGLNPRLGAVAKWLPYDYFRGGESINGLQWAQLLGLLVVTASLAALAWQLFERRDIRVAGEGGWRIPSLPFRRRAQA